MAQPSNTVASYDITGIREDMTDMIYDVSPDDTPFYSKSPKTKAKNTYHEWQTDALRSSAVNAHIEGDDTVADSRATTTRLGNYTQIFKNAVTISGTDSALDKAGRSGEMAKEITKIGMEQKLDIEKALFANQARDAGNNTGARYMAGVPAWLTTNTEFESGSSGADPTGDGTDARTDDGTPVAFTQARLNTVLQSVWESGGKPDTVYLSAFQMNLALGFTGNNNQRSTIRAKRGSNEVVNHMDVYVTPWGTVEFMLSRENRARDIFVMQSDMWAIANLRGTRNEPLAKSGDSDKRQVLTELTLVSRNEKASGGVFDNTTS